jgi:prepilin-type N-terminal cleavage/methylation domain-containing protein
MRSSLGYTLIELLVVITIMGLLVGGGIASYIHFNERQTVLAAGKQFLLTLRSAQSKANSGIKPTGCTTLRGYNVTGSNGSSSYALTAVCSNNAAIAVSTFSLGTGITFGSAVNITFFGLAGGASGTTGTITIASGQSTYTLIVNTSGDVSEGGLQ